MSALYVSCHFSVLTYHLKGHGFETTIRAFYEQINKGRSLGNRKVEIIFVSCDNSPDEYQDHLSALPFPAIPFESSKIADLEEDLDVDSIPIVPLVAKEGVILQDSVRMLIQKETPDFCLNEMIKIIKNSKILH